MVLHVEKPILSGDDPTANDSESNAMLKSHAYFTQTAGFVTAYDIDDQTLIAGYVHTTSNPAGAGTKVAQMQAAVVNSDQFISFFVANGKYFEVTAGGTPTITWTPFILGGGAPVDHD